MNSKPSWKSKTLWVAAVVSLAGFIPGAGGVAASNPEVVGLALGVLFGILRFVTKGKVTIT